MKSKRGLIISDFHCGHAVGLTPPAFNPASEKDATGYEVRKRDWDFYATAKKHGPYDFIIVNGDAIDGKGEKSGGTEQLTTDREKQCNMAVACIDLVKGGGAKVLMSYGTPYHTGMEEDWENQVALEVEAEKICDAHTADVNGLLINYRHFSSTAAAPQSAFTGLARDRLVNLLWNEHDEFPKADVIIRSHIHRWRHCGEWGWYGLTTPGLQGYGSKFGARKCNRVIDFGYLVMEVTDKNDFEVTPFIDKRRPITASVIKI